MALRGRAFNFRCILPGVSLTRRMLSHYTTIPTQSLQFEAEYASMGVQARSATLVDALWPRAGVLPQDLLRNLILIVGFAALVAVCGRIRFYLPDHDFLYGINPIPVTMQTFAVLVTGVALGTWRGTSSLLLFYFVGMAGVPVFQGGNNGWSYVTDSPTGGYLIGFVAAAFITGFLAERSRIRGGTLWILLVGSILIYIPGLLWLGAKGFVPWGSVLSKGLYPFIPGDLLKLMMVGIVLPSAWAMVNLRDRNR